jgi:hypothetical protein
MVGFRSANQKLSFLDGPELDAAFAGADVRRLTRREMVGLPIWIWVSGDKLGYARSPHFRRILAFPEEFG